MSESTAWSDEHGPWPPQPAAGFRVRIKRPLVRAAAAWHAPADPADGVAILAYHATEPDGRHGRWIDFQGHMAMLDGLGYAVVSLADAVDRVRSGQPGDRPCAAITFDDGWASNLEVAFPELARRGWPATVFLTTAFVGRRPFLHGSEVRHLLDVGITPELHTESHPDMTQLSDADIARELAQCRSRIEDLSGYSPRFFCYPYGWLNRRVRDVVAASGVDAACTGIPGRNRPGQDLLLLRRVTPDFGDSPRDLRAGLAGGGARLARLRALLGAAAPSIDPNV